MASWGIVATVKAPEQKVLAFVAHHLAIGADHIWLYFDDPEAPIPDVLTRHPRVAITRCEAAYWADKKRHERHQNRQARNARDAYQRATTDWLTHIDVDEFLYTPRPVADLLDNVSSDIAVLKFEPFEAMHDPLLPDDIYTARAFRGALRQEHHHLRGQVLGDYQGIVRDGLMSHKVGKVIFRTGIRGLSPRLHSVMKGGTRLGTPDWHPDLKLLHFHAQDREAWLAALPFRLTRGAYQFRPELQAYLTDATPEEVDQFYLGTQVLTATASGQLQAVGRVIIAELGLRAKVQTLMSGTL